MRFKVSFRDTVESELMSTDSPVSQGTLVPFKFPGQRLQFYFKTFYANVAICFKIPKIVQTSVLVIPFLEI